MNRTIKFRGKGIANNEWYYGDLIQVESGRVHYFIIQDYEIQEQKIELNTCASPEVNPETVGQYTGLHDKNGKEIYEGDIVYCQTKFGKAKSTIKFLDGKFVAYWDSALTHMKNGHQISCYDINKKFEVIGNIYDNPESLVK